MKALLIILILLSALILGVAAGVRCHRRLAKKQASPKISELPHIPEDAVLNSLNRGQRLYDEADSLLCAGRLLPDGSVISMKYNGMGEKELFELLKSFL